MILLSKGKFRKTTGCFDPLVMHFPDYTKGIINQDMCCICRD